MSQLLLLAASLQVLAPLTVEEQLPQGHALLLEATVVGAGKLAAEGGTWAPQLLRVEGEEARVVAEGLVIKPPKKPLRAGKKGTVVQVALPASATRALPVGRSEYRLRLNTRGGPTDSEGFWLWIVPENTRLPGDVAGKALRLSVEAMLWAGDTDTATALTEKAFERPSARYDPAVLESLGRVYEATGFRDDAMAMYDHAAHATAGQDPETANRMVEGIRRVKKARKRKGSKPMKHPDMKHEH